MSEFEEGYAEVNGIRLHYASAGTGPLMLFVHGFPEFWYCWRKQLSEFSRDHRALAPDLRGFNLSDKPADIKSYRSHHVVADLRELIAKFGGGKAIVVAHDWGGAMAWALAIAHPECVERLIIINSPHAIPFARELAVNPAQQAASAYMLFFRKTGAEHVLAADNFERLAHVITGRGDDGGAPLTADDLARYREAWSQPGALTGSLNWYRATPIYPPSEGDPGAAGLKLDPADFMVRVPTLVIWGERDTALLPALLDGLEAVVPELTIARIPDGSHWVIREKPEEINRLIRNFIES